MAAGITGKFIQGAAYSVHQDISTASHDLKFANDVGKPTLSTAFGIDAGVVLRPAPWLRLGVVGKDLNEPALDAAGGGQYTLNPQVRGGLAINPYRSLTLTADADATANRTMVPGIKSRIVSVGPEQVMTEILALRVGALKNVEHRQSHLTLTAGLGLRLFFLQLDLGAGYDFREPAALGSFSLALTF